MGKPRTSSSRHKMLVALMFPQLMVVLNLTMVNVALPAIRESFNAPADLMAWVVTIYMLPYVALMPLYGRLGDDLGIRRMILVGAIAFLIGTTLNALSQSLPALLLGRFIQGIGASGMVPLAITMITRIFSPETRGRALGQWNSIGPVAGVTGTLLSGILIDWLGWHVIFVVPILAGTLAVVLVRWALGASEHPLQLGALREFDWTGVLLLSAALTGLLFYVTSRPITGRAPFTDWRLLIATLVLLAAFVWQERRLEAPFIDLSLLVDPEYLKVSISAATRMFIMSGTAFLTPLFLADINELNASMIGLILMLRSAALFPTMYFGGRVADRWGSRLPIALGLSVQAASVGLLALAHAGSLIWMVVGLLVNGLGAGLALPALHRAAMDDPEGQRGGAAAGLYSMIRFWGMMLGTAVAGVLLQSLLDTGVTLLASYRLSYGCTILVGFIGVLSAFGLRQERLGNASEGAGLNP